MDEHVLGDGTVGTGSASATSSTTGSSPARRRRRRALLGSLVASSLLAAGCALVGPNGPTAPNVGPVERSCSAAAVVSCALPYPSDQFTVADPSTATGRRVVMPSDLIAEGLLDQLGPGAQPSDAFAGADGFASLSPVTFEIDRSVVADWVPRDGGDIVSIVDTTTGEPVDIRVEVPAEAARHGARDTLVVAWPTTSFEPGHTYVARVGRGLVGAAGGTPAPAPGLSGSSEYLSALRTQVERHGLGPWRDVVSATMFTVRSRSNATSELDRMTEIVRSVDHPMRNVAVQAPWLISDAAAVVTGEVRISDFRDEHGVARAANGATDRWVPFQLVLPERPAGGDAGAPVVLYGHGLLAAKETMTFTASTNASKGLATIGIDVPNHGGRQYGGPDQGYLLELSTPGTFGRLASMPLQGIVDQVSLLMAVQDHLGELRIDLPPAIDGTPRTAPRLDTTRVLYEGTSMGGVLGAAFTALAPELDGAFLQVAGTGIADTIFHSLLWPLFMNVIPQGATAGDAYALMGSATMLLDHADNVNLLERIRSNGTPTFLAYGANDGVVPNGASDRLISAVDLPLVGPQLAPIGVPHRTTGSDRVPADGWGAAQFWPTSAPELAPFAAHLVFADAGSEHALREWLDGRLAALGVASR